MHVAPFGALARLGFRVGLLDLPTTGVPPLGMLLDGPLAPFFKAVGQKLAIQVGPAWVYPKYARTPFSMYCQTW